MTIDTALEWMHSRLNFGIRPGLDRVEALLTLLGNPQKELSMIHIAGTNGKGSTTAFVRDIFMKAGLEVGTFTSPFIERFNERISINGVGIPDEKLLFYVEKIQPLVAQLDANEALKGITEFEIITAMSFAYFCDEKVDLAVIEVGLGGLLDSTNVITPIVSGITTIGMDHMDILGNTIEKIAAQKAGIVKENIPVVTGNIVPNALAVIGEIAKGKQAPIYQLGTAYRFMKNKNEQWGENFDFLSEDLMIKEVQTSLIGQHQIENAAMAIELAKVYAEKASMPLTEEQIKAGIKATFWPARMEKASEKPLIVLDGAHNIHAMMRLIENIESAFGEKKITILFSAITTKDITQMIEMLQTIKGAELVLTTFDFPKALKIKDYAHYANERTRTAESWQKELDCLKINATQDELILVTGSLYFMSQVREYLKK